MSDEKKSLPEAVGVFLQKLDTSGVDPLDEHVLDEIEEIETGVPEETEQTGKRKVKE